MIHNHSSGKCRLLKRFFVICMVLLLICSVSPNLITAEADTETRESVSEDFAEENIDNLISTITDIQLNINMEKAKVKLQEMEQMIKIKKLLNLKY